VEGALRSGGVEEGVQVAEGSLALLEEVVVELGDRGGDDGCRGGGAGGGKNGRHRSFEDEVAAHVSSKLRRRKRRRKSRDCTLAYVRVDGPGEGRDVRVATAGGVEPGPVDDAPASVLQVGADLGGLPDGRPEVLGEARATAGPRHFVADGRGRQEVGAADGSAVGRARGVRGIQPIGAA